MKAILKRNVQGDFHGIQAVGLYGVRKGDVVDLEPRDVLRYLKTDLVELPRERRIPILGVRDIPPENPNAGDIAKLQKQIDEEDAKRPPPPRVTGRSWDGNTFVYPGAE